MISAQWAFQILSNLEVVPFSSRVKATYKYLSVTQKEISPSQILSNMHFHKWTIHLCDKLNNGPKDIHTNPLSLWTFS
jgi:hypothetical protein